eukprot:TRINITY_DN3869_c0_g1_i1.p1 TRINITY_DN3869_c0_g1~~TRINITY_DN3869_c0_g1_i1.p1  ORF type:complete len:125 (+),score=7.34 TRINITY_DN3869_c0_g1_i1:105-479(+)
MFLLPSTTRQLICAGALNAGLAVAFGAFGAHGLKNHVKDPVRMKAWETASQYHMTHALGLLLCANLEPRVAMLPAQILSVAMVLFSGSIYALVLTDTPKLGAITPIGGTLMLVGWGLLAYRTME